MCTWMCLRDHRARFTSATRLPQLRDHGSLPSPTATGGARCRRSTATSRWRTTPSAVGLPRRGHDPRSGTNIGRGPSGQGVMIGWTIRNNWFENNVASAPLGTRNDRLRHHPQAPSGWQRRLRLDRGDAGERRHGGRPLAKNGRQHLEIGWVRPRLEGETRLEGDDHEGSRMLRRALILGGLCVAVAAVASVGWAMTSATNDKLRRLREEEERRAAARRVREELPKDRTSRDLESGGSAWPAGAEGSCR